jgi:hypothetical protein
MGDGDHADRTVAEIERLGAEIDELLRPVVARLQGLLDELVGESLDTFEENQELARTVQGLAQRLGVRVECLRCGKPAWLRYQRGGARGYFVFQHAEGGKTSGHSGSALLPPLKLVPAPPDRRKSDEPPGRRKSK